MSPAHAESKLRFDSARARAGFVGFFHCGGFEETATVEERHTATKRPLLERTFIRYSEASRMEAIKFLHK